MGVNTDYIVGEFTKRAALITDLDALGVLFFNTLNRLGFTEWGYQAIHKGQSTPTVLSTFPKEWVEHYLDNNFSEVDPLVTKAPMSFAPFQWSDIINATPLTDRQKHYWMEASDYGLTEGIGIPIHGYNGRLAIVTLVSRQLSQQELNRIFHEYRDQIHILSLIYNSYASDILTLHKTSEKQDIKLTAREKECLQWVARGKTSWEISNILHISEHTIIFHIENAKKKFGVFNRNEAVIKGIISGILEPE